MAVGESQPQWPLDKREIALSAAAEKALPPCTLTHSLQGRFKLPYSEHKLLFIYSSSPTGQDLLESQNHLGWIKPFKIMESKQLTQH